MTKEQKLRLIITLTFAGMAGAFIYHGVMGRVFHAGFPLDTFLFSPADRYMDFIREYHMSSDPYATTDATRGLFPFSKLIALAFERSVDAWPGLTILLLSFTAGMLAYTALNLKSFKPGLRIPGLVMLGAINYPFLFTFDRAHLEIFVFFALAVFAGLFKRERYRAGAAILAAAIALSPYPAIFLLLYAKHRQYRYGIAALAGGMVLHFASLAAFPGGLWLNMASQRVCMDNYFYDYVLNNNGLLFRHSLFSMIKAILLQIYPEFMVLAGHIRIYLLLVAAIFSVAMFGFFKYSKTLWLDITILTCCMTLFPYTSADYRLIHFFIPLFMFITTETASRFDRWFCVLFALLLIPKAYGSSYTSVVLNPLIIFGLLALALHTAQTEDSGPPPKNYVN